MIFLFYKSSCRVPPNFTSYEAQSETNLAFPYLCGYTNSTFFAVSNLVKHLVKDLGKFWYSFFFVFGHTKTITNLLSVHRRRYRFGFIKSFQDAQCLRVIIFLHCTNVQKGFLAPHFLGMTPNLF